MNNNKITNPVKELEDAFDSCVGILANSNCQQSSETDEELKLSVEQCVKKFTDKAKELEIFFIQKRFQFVNQKPEQLLIEDINDIKTEIARKDQLIERFNNKINHWQNILSDNPLPTVNNQQQMITNQNPMINNLQQQQLAAQSLNIRHQQQRSPIQSIANNPSPIHQQANIKMMSPYQAQTYTPQSNSMIPDSPMSSPMNHQMHPQSIPQSQPSTYTPNPQQTTTSQQSHLAFLEKTTKSIH